jgi:protein tyrosine/serine phosphatase
MKNNLIYIIAFITISIFIVFSDYDKSQDKRISSNYKINEKHKEEFSNNIIKTQKINLPRKFDTVPGGNNVYRSNQPTLSQLKYILETHDINTVIRMNDTEGTGVTPDSEKNLVQNLGKTYIWINAHIGYEKNKGYVKSIDSIQPYLKKGKVLIHCTAGADRTGYQIARYIKDAIHWSEIDIWKYTIKYNNWEKHICQNKKGYIRYMEGFLTLDKWCLYFGKTCKSCL